MYKWIARNHEGSSNVINDRTKWIYIYNGLLHCPTKLPDLSSITTQPPSRPCSGNSHLLIGLQWMICKGRRSTTTTWEGRSLGGVGGRNQRPQPLQELVLGGVLSPGEVSSPGLWPAVVWWSERNVVGINIFESLREGRSSFITTESHTGRHHWCSALSGRVRGRVEQRSLSRYLIAIICVLVCWFLIRTRWGWKYSKDIISIKFRNKGWKRTIRSWCCNPNSTGGFRCTQIVGYHYFDHHQPSRGSSVRLL